MNSHILQKGDIPKAASAAFTHHVYDPDYNISRENVEWYRKQLAMDHSLIDREAFVSIIYDSQLFFLPNWKTI